MGHSEYDPGMNGRLPWNAGRKPRGQARAEAAAGLGNPLLAEPGWQKTGRPVQFELLEPARGSLLAWLERRVIRR